jgi:hypothetical protein
MFIPNPFFLPIPVPGSQNSKKRGLKKSCCDTFLCSHKFQEMENYFIKKFMIKCCPIFEKLFNSFHKLAVNCKKYGVCA